MNSHSPLTYWWQHVNLKHITKSNKQLSVSGEPGRTESASSIFFNIPTFAPFLPMHANLRFKKHLLDLGEWNWKYTNALTLKFEVISYYLSFNTSKKLIRIAALLLIKNWLYQVCLLFITYILTSYFFHHCF